MSRAALRASYYRNAINNGLIPVECDPTGIAEGDRLVIELGEDTPIVRDETRQIVVRGAPLPPHMLRILAAGGLVPYFREHGGVRGRVMKLPTKILIALVAGARNRRRGEDV